jgi:hypothetical protein
LLCRLCHERHHLPAPPETMPAPSVRAIGRALKAHHAATLRSRGT